MDAHSANNAVREALRNLPAVDHLLKRPAIIDLLADYPRGEVVRVIRAVLERVRKSLLEGAPEALDTPSLALEVRQRLYERSRPNLRRVINATGIVLHTGLGRAPLAKVAVEAVAEVAAGYCNLELNLADGRRGDRHDHLRELLRELTGAEDALVVNNNAAATYLALNTLAAGREAIISRGELVEIGGSFRLPDIMAAAGCHMIEVGTTNRTRQSDYERAISDETAVLLRVHTSNYRINGFTESTSLAELVELARRHNLVVIDDIGSGLLTTDLPWTDSPDAEPGDADDQAEQLATTPADWDEPTVLDSMAGAADLALFSGDKLIGGPQAGIIVGRADLIAALRTNPLARTFRPDKMTLAGLEATVRLYRDRATVTRHIPAFRMLARTPSELRAAALRLAHAIADALPAATVHTEPDYSEGGGGSLATIPFPTHVVAVSPAQLPPEKVAMALRQRDLPIICRLRDGALVFDPRTLEADELDQIPGALAEVMRELEGE